MKSKQARVCLKIHQFEFILLITKGNFRSSYHFDSLDDRFKKPLDIGSTEIDQYTGIFQPPKPSFVVRIGDIIVRDLKCIRAVSSSMYHSRWYNVAIYHVAKESQTSQCA